MFWLAVKLKKYQLVRTSWYFWLILFHNKWQGFYGSIATKLH
jgi:hypothetical protein